MSFYVVFFITVLGAMCLAYLTQKGVGRSFAVVNLSLIFFLYASGLFTRLDIGMYLFFAAVAGLIVPTTIRLIKKKDFAAFLRSSCNVVTIFYCITGVTLGVVFTKMIPWHWDELTQWALVTKNMFAYGNFGNLGDTTTMFNRYVPATGVFMYAFQFFNKTFVDGHLYAAFDLLAVSMLLPVTELFKKKASAGCMLSLLVVLLVPVAMKITMYAELLVDGILGVATGYMFVVFLADKGKEDWFTAVEMGLATMALVLIKTSGMALVFFALAYALVEMLTRDRRGLKYFLRRRLVLFLVPVVVLVLCKVSWNVYCDHFQVRAGWNASEMTLSNFLAYLKTPNEFQKTVTENFFRTYFLGKFYLEFDAYVQMPNLFFYGVVALFCFALWFGTKNKTYAGVQFGTIILLLFSYGVVQLVLYIFSFSYAESLTLAAYARYYSTMTISTLLVLVYQCIEVFVAPRSNARAEKSVDSPKRKRNYAISFASGVCAMLVIAVSLGTYFASYIDRVNAPRHAPYQAWINATDALDTEDSVYYVMTGYKENNASVRIYLKIRYYCTPTRCNGFTEGGSYAEGRGAKLFLTGNPFYMGMTSETFASETSRYDYLFIDKVNDAFVEKFGAYFDGRPKSKVLYRCVKAEGTVRFVLADTQQK